MSTLRVLLVGAAAGWWLGQRAARRARVSDIRQAPRGAQFDFLSLMSHELKTPVNVISGYLELLEDGIPERLPETARGQVHQARMAALRLTDLVNDLITLGRLQNRTERPHPEQVEASEIVADACGAVADRADSRRVALDIDVGPDLVLRTDRQRACQALRALIANGVKFTEEGSVRISVDGDDERVRFRVRDTGIGIAPEHLHRIFQPYWQLEATVSRTRGGAGIGLTVARELARLLGGDVTVRSVPGDGSEFVLELQRWFPIPASENGAGGAVP